MLVCLSECKVREKTIRSILTKFAKNIIDAPRLQHKAQVSKAADRIILEGERGRRPRRGFVCDFVYFSISNH